MDMSAEGRIGLRLCPLFMSESGAGCWYLPRGDFIKYLGLVSMWISLFVGYDWLLARVSVGFLPSIGLDGGIRSKGWLSGYGTASSF